MKSTPQNAGVLNALRHPVESALEMTRFPSADSVFPWGNVRSDRPGDVRFILRPRREEDPAGNLLADREDPERPNDVWVGDITYLKVKEGWLYLAAVLDLHARKLIGWTLSERMTSDIVVSASNMAIKQRGVVPQVFHSDKGSQYTSTVFRNLLRKNSVQISNSGVGNCYDNATMERFFRTLKEECTDRLPLMAREALKRVVFDFVEVFYNRQRIHSALGYLTPEDFEAQQADQRHEAA